MTIHLNDLSTLATIASGVVAFIGSLFVALRYVIRSETAELRTNGGSTIKDAVNRIEEEQTAARLEQVQMRREQTRTREKLEEHIEDSQEVKNRMQATIDNLSAALPVVAASTPPEASHGAP